MRRAIYPQPSLPSLFMSLSFILQLLYCTAAFGSDRKPEQNAALQYWPALDAIPHTCNAGDDWGAARHDSIHVPLSEVQTILTDFHRTTVLGNARRGARMPYCDWGLPSLNVPLVHSQRFHSLGALFIINARQLLAEGKPDQAIDDLVSLILVGRHIASDGTIPSHLIRYQHEERSLRMIAYILPQLSRDSVFRLDKQLKGLGVGPTPVDFVNSQRDFWLSWLRQCDSAEKRAVARDSVLSDTAQEFADSTAFQDAFATDERMQRLIDEADSIYKQMEVAAGKPFGEFEQGFKQLETTMIAASPAARTLLASLTPNSHIRLLKERQAARATELSLLLAAISYRLSGEAVLPDIDDPVLSKPPAIVLADKSFILKSMSILTSEEVSMVFGEGALPPPRERPNLVYPIDADAKAEIAAALKKSQRQNKMVLVHFGGNWCAPCVRLHNILTKNELVAPIIQKHYVVVKVNVGRYDKNMDVADRYGLDLRSIDVPILLVLDSDGRPICPPSDEGNVYISSLDAETLAELLSAIPLQ